MKLSPLLTPIAFGLLTICPAARAAELGILIEYIELDEPSATKLLRAHGGKADASGLRAQLQSKIEAGEAKVSATAYLRTTDSRRAKVESVHEFIYPTEFDPPEIPQQLTGPIAAGVDLTIHANPTAYEMRPVGVVLEVEPKVADDGKTIDISIAPEKVEFVGYKTYGKDESEAKQPLFYAMQTSTSLTMTSGSYVLLAVHTPRLVGGEGLTGDPGKRVLLMLRADVVDATEAENAGGDGGDDK